MIILRSKCIKQPQWNGLEIMSFNPIKITLNWSITSDLRSNFFHWEITEWAQVRLRCTNVHLMSWRRSQKLKQMSISFIVIGLKYITYINGPQERQLSNICMDFDLLIVCAGVWPLPPTLPSLLHFVVTGTYKQVTKVVKKKQKKSMTTTCRNYSSATFILFPLFAIRILACKLILPIKPLCHTYCIPFYLY